VNTILLNLTRIKIRLDGGRFLRLQTAKASNGVEQDVFVFSQNPNHFVAALTGLVFFAVALAIPCSFSWQLELNAEFVAIKTIGLEEYETARALEENRDSSRINVVYHKSLFRL
jgi:hypothetical protein